jgi:hypothetical protein
MKLALTSMRFTTGVALAICEINGIYKSRDRDGGTHSAVNGHSEARHPTARGVVIGEAAHRGLWQLRRES